MNTNIDSVEVEVVDLTVTKEDIDEATEGEVPPGGIIKVLQIIAEAEIGGKKKTNQRIHVSDRKAALGKEPSGICMDTDTDEQQQQQEAEEHQRRVLEERQAHEQQVQFAAQPPLPPHHLAITTVPTADNAVAMDERSASRKRHRTHIIHPSSPPTV